MDVPSERIQEESPFETAVGCNQLVLLHHGYADIAPQGCRVAAAPMRLLECLQGLLDLATLKGNSPHSNETVVLLRVQLQCLLEIFVGVVISSHLTTADPQQLQHLWIFIRNP